MSLKVPFLSVFGCLYTFLWFRCAYNGSESRLRQSRLMMSSNIILFHHGLTLAEAKNVDQRLATVTEFLAIAQPDEVPDHVSLSDIRISKSLPWTQDGQNHPDLVVSN